MDGLYAHTYIIAHKHKGLCIVMWCGCKYTSKTWLKVPHVDVIWDKVMFWFRARLLPVIFRLKLYRKSWVCLPSVHPSSLQPRQNLIGVKENFMFSPQLLVFVFPSSQKMTHFSCRGLRNEINLFLYGLNSLICSVQAAKEYTTASEQLWDGPEWINGDMNIYFILFLFSAYQYVIYT